MSKRTDRSPKIRLRITTILQAFIIHVAVNLQTLWGLLVSFVYNLRNIKKYQRDGPGLSLSMQTRIGFPGGKSCN